MFNIKEKLNRFLDDIEEAEGSDENKINGDPQDFKAKQAELAKYLDTLKAESTTEPIRPQIKPVETPSMQIPKATITQVDYQKVTRPQLKAVEPVVINHVQNQIETSIICDDVVITGDIITNDPLQFEGYLKGNMESSSKVTINGTLDGNVKAAAAQIHASTINGSINCDQNVIVTGNSHITGDIHNDNLAFNGTIQGNIYSKGKVQIDENAEIYGNVMASTISIDEGAIVQGNVKINTSKKSY